ncbi:hypothetical protein [Sulfuricurvum sp. MLSB]|uniref:hypothetical protein n=1 Tax=Sulfuricurvum sp. MLSB TaxID=1537917 RepID=UPI0025DB1E63|nr:hypothetical protein [Sulfuricurvum sp. MLSB]
MMSWREFQLRSFGYKRKDRQDWLKVREVAYSSLVGSHLDPKKLPKTKEKFLPLGMEQQKRVSDEQKENFLKAFRKYQNERKT